MITLISRWKLRAGCPHELAAELRSLAATVEREEPDTWLYSVHLPAQAPLDAEGRARRPQPPPVPPEQCDEVIFFEVYADAEAFARHLNGPTFTRFREGFLPFFYEDPARPGWPQTVTTFLERSSAFVRDAGR